MKRKESNDDPTKETNLLDLSSGMVDDVLSICSISQYKEEWLLNFGGCHHMCLYESWFSSYQSTNEGVILMGNNVSCKTVGIESINIWMFNGIVRTLIEVRHVLELKKNLISLGVLDFGGYKYIGQGGALEVLKGSVVVMKNARIGNLYKMKMST